MSRTQLVLGNGNIVLTAVLQQLDPVVAFYKSITVQASFGNTGTVIIADIYGVTMIELPPGLACTVLGDNMDNGTAAKVDISSIQVASNVPGDVVHVSICKGL